MELEPDDVRCPQCDADPGEPCVSVRRNRAGQVVGITEWEAGFHHARRLHHAYRTTRLEDRRLAEGTAPSLTAVSSKSGQAKSSVVASVWDR